MNTASKRIQTSILPTVSFPVAWLLGKAVGPNNLLKNAVYCNQWLLLVFLAACSTPTHSLEHQCDNCLACEECVLDDSGKAVCSVTPHATRKCSETAQAIVWFDSCGNQEEIAEDCVENATCDDSGVPACVCNNQWTGDNCSVCPPNADAALECAICKNQWTGADCSICPGNWDNNKECAVCKNQWTGADCSTCPGNWDENQECAVCKNQWTGADCSICPENWDESQECAVCKNQWTEADCFTCPGNWDENQECAVCKNQWTGADCSICPENWDESQECAVCKNQWTGVECSICPGNWDESQECAVCKNQWTGADCSICPGNWDESQECAVCKNQWTGADCSICPGNWDENQECAVCKNQWTGADCSICPENWDENQECAVCLGNWNIANDCTTCLNSWVDNDNHCSTCPENRDETQGCTDCLGNWDIANDCTTCLNGWVDSDDNCSTCPENWDESQGCTVCLGNWDIANNCTTCLDGWNDDSNDCSTCPGNWDETTDCTSCLYGYDEQSDCVTCRVGWHAPSCSLCRIYVNESATGVIKDGDAWDTAFSSLEDGIALALAETPDEDPGCAIWVAAGTYTPTITSAASSFILQKNIRLYGGFDGSESLLSERDLKNNTTTLSGQGDVWHVVQASGNIHIDGFVIKSGNGILDGASKNGGGVYHTSGKLSVYNTRFVGNYASSGGGIASYGETLLMQNVAMYRNYASSVGHAVYLSDVKANIVNCTFSHHNFAIDGAGFGTIYASEGTTTIYNTIVWGNRDGELVGYQPDYTVAYSVIEEGYPFGGIMILDVDPQLDSDRYHLLSSSPCIGAGLSNISPKADLEGDSRGSVVDIGADEY